MRCIPVGSELPWKLIISSYLAVSAEIASYHWTQPVEILFSASQEPGQPGEKEFRRLAPVARDAMAVFLYRFADTVLGQDVDSYTPPSTSPFVDVRTDNVFYTQISWLAHEGISTGWDVGGAPGSKEFRPLSSVNRDAMARFMFELMVDEN